MPLFLLSCRDKPHTTELRQAIRPAHLAYIQAHEAQIILAGPMLDEHQTPLGSLIVLECPDRGAADAFAAADPYTTAGLFSHVEITHFRKVLPAC